MHEVELQDEDFELYAGFAVRKQYNGVEVTTDEHHQTYLVGTPIQSSIKLPFSAWILNIKDERKYPPTTDRERLSEGAEKQLLEKVRAKLREALSFLQTPGTGAPPSSKYKEILRQYSKLGLEDYLSPETRDYCDFLNIQVRHPGSKEKATISDLLDGPTELFYLSTLNPRKMAAIRREVPTAAFFRFATRSEVDEFSLALRHGVRVADDFIRENRLKLRDEDAGYDVDNKPVVIHQAGEGWYSWGRFKCTTRRCKRTDPNEVDQRTIRIPRGQMPGYLGILSQLGTEYKLVMDRKGLEGGIQLERFVDQLASKRMLTNKGSRALSELKSSVEKARICVYSDPTIANSYTASKNLIVFSEEDEVFELAIFLTFHSVEYSIDSSGHGAFDEAFGKTDAKAWEFINDSSYAKVGDAEVLFSVIHASRAISDTGVKELFLNAARHLKEAEGVRKMREAAFSIDRKLKSKR